MNQNIIDILELFIETDLFDESLTTGNLALFRRLLTHGYKRTINQRIEHMSAICHAARCGHLEMVKWLHSYVSRAFCANVFHVFHKDYDERYTTKVMDHAAAAGHLHVVKWLHSNVKSLHEDKKCLNPPWCHDQEKCLHKTSAICTKDAMDRAARFGHLEVVKFLHKNRKEGCTTDAMNYAASNSQLEVVKWLHENRTEGCTTIAMDRAANWGHLEMVKWLHENRSEGCTEYAMIFSGIKGHFEVLKFLYEFMHEISCSKYEFDSVAEFRNHVEVVYVRYDHYTDILIVCKCKDISDRLIDENKYESEYHKHYRIIYRNRPLL